MERILFGRDRGIVSITGGGGKTSLMFGLARHLASMGKRVLTTTTTRIHWPTVGQSLTVIVEPDPERLVRDLSQSAQSRHITAVAEILQQGRKLKGFGPEAIDFLGRSGLFDWILVEADGAAHRPLKAPADHEPVVPATTSIHVAVIGLDVVGKPLTGEWVFRSELAAPRLGLASGDAVTPEALVRLIAHPDGLFRGTPLEAKRVLFLNKAEDPYRRARGEEIAELLRDADVRTDLVVIGEASGAKW